MRSGTLNWMKWQWVKWMLSSSFFWFRSFIWPFASSVALCGDYAGIDEQALKEKKNELEQLLMADAQACVAGHGDISRPGHGRATLLHIAAANGYSDLVDYLVANGANVS